MLRDGQALQELTDAMRQGNLRVLTSLTPTPPPLRVLNTAEFLALDIPERAVILTPWLFQQSLNMIHSWRGIGKTYVGLNIAYAIASAGSFLTWTAPKPIKVLYIDGEMPASAMQSRLRDIVLQDDREFDPAYLRIITPDMQNGQPMPDLATADGQDAIQEVLGDAELIIVDNISCLVRGTERENDAESWREVGTWALRMRQQSRSAVFMHHSGKDLRQRGSSKREDVLDTVMSLRRPSDYTPDQGARFEVHYEKFRNSAGAEAKPIEALLTTGPNGRPTWTYRDVEDCTFDRVVALANEGLRGSDIAAELGINKSNVSRHLSRARALGMIISKGAA